MSGPEESGNRAEGVPVLVSEEEIGARVREIANRISLEYAEADELILVGVLKGAFIFLADLARALELPRCIEFMALSSYERGGHATDAVRLLLDLRSDIGGKHVLVVEDILDSGRTLGFLLGTLSARRPASLRSCVLVRKRRERPTDVRPDYVGFEIPDEWVVGYGLDYDERYRTLPYIGILPERLR